MKPILFNTEMVKAILDGRKTVTRRLIKYQLNRGHTVLGCDPETHVFSILCGCAGDGAAIDYEVHRKAPFWPGDILYVRETWAWDGPEDDIGTGCFLYKADGKEYEGLKWRPSIHMVKEAARIFLRVTDVRPEKLHDITEEQAKAEGASKAYPYDDPRTGKTAYMIDDNATYIGGFAAIWDSTIKFDKLRKHGWDGNPWVWVIEFEVCDKPEEVVQ